MDFSIEGVITDKDTQAFVSHTCMLRVPMILEICGFQTIRQPSLFLRKVPVVESFEKGLV